MTRARRYSHRPASAGMTLLEIMIVLAVIGGVMTLGLSMVRRITSADLREQAAEVVAVMRAAYGMAAQSGKHHRVLLDLEEQTFQIQTCEDDVKLRKLEEEEQVDEEALARLAERGPRSDQIEEILDADTPEEALAQAAALEGTRIGPARCRMPEKPNGDADGRGNLRQVNTGLGIEIQRVHVQHLEEPVNDGPVSINFFPVGYSEKAVIEIVSDDGDQHTLLVHRLTGRIELRKGDFDAEDHMQRDAAGEEVEER